MKVAISKIKPDTNQPRKTFDDIEGLAQTIKEQGLLQPLLVDEDYKIIDGERRWRACKELGMEEIDVIVRPVKEENKRLVLQCIEDIQHKDLPILERDQAWLTLWNELGKPTNKELAKIIGATEQKVSDSLERARFVPNIPPEGFLPPATAITFTKGLPTDIRKKALKKIATSGLKANATEVYPFVQRLKRAKNKEEQEKILDEPITDYYKQAERVIQAIDTIIGNLTGELITLIPATQAFVLSSKIVFLKKHLKDYNATEGEIVE